MTSAYGGHSSAQPLALSRSANIKEELSLPEAIECTSKDGQQRIVHFDRYKHPEDHEGLFHIFQEVVEDGVTYPQESVTCDEFDAYFLSHDAYVFRDTASNQVVAGFYVKPNFPGRSSHIANGGVIVRRDWQGRGVGFHLFGRMIKMAALLGYQSFYTNLVFVSNGASVRLCQKHGLVQTGTLPGAGRLKGHDSLVDALQFYKKLASD